MGYYLRKKRATMRPFRRFGALRRKIPWKHREKKRRRVTTSGYCLYCFYSPLDSSHRCVACDQVSLPSMRREYWNLHPRLIRFEKLGKLLGLVALPGGVFALWIVSIIRGGGSGGGWVCVMPLLVSVGIWKTAGKITRHDPYFRPSLIWGLTGIGLCAAFLPIDLRLSAAFFVIAVIVILLCVRAERWKLSLIGLRGEEAEA